MASFATFSATIEPGKRTRIVPVSDIKLSHVTFGKDIKDEAGRSTVTFYYRSPMGKLEQEDEDEEEEEEEDSDEEEGEIVEAVLAHLQPGRIETQVLSTIFHEEVPVEFEVTGKNPVQLIGNYIDQRPDFGQGYGDMDSDSDEEEDQLDEESYALEDVSSDVEIDPSAVVGLDIDSDDVAEAAPGKLVEVIEEAITATETKKEKKSKKERKEEKKEKKRARESEVDATMADEAGEKETSKDKKKNKKQKTEDGAVATGGATVVDKSKSGYDKIEKHTLPSGVTVDIRTVGEGPPAKIGQKLSMRYIGKLQKDMTVFDKNTKGKPFTFKLGSGEVIKGWDEGLVGLRPGAEAVLTIPPNLAYGNQKIPMIPAGSTLRFEVRVLSIS